MKQEIRIGNRKVGEGHPIFTIAEIGSNHNLDKKVVKKLIDTASETGFDSVKFQTYDPLEVFSGKITTKDVNYEKLYGNKPWWQVARDKILMPREWFGEMFEYARNKNLIVFSTVHSAEDAEFVMQFNPPAFKVASIDVTYLDFLEELAKFGKPIILSSGMSSFEEIEEAVDTILDSGNKQLALLHCISCYPPKPEIVNLRNILTFKEKFDIPVGFSDHSQNNTLAIASIALGACIIEKHITLDRKMEGPDHPFALNPKLMKELIESIREVESGLGVLDRILSNEELKAKKQIRRSVVARRKINKGEKIEMKDIKLARPGTGIPPKQLKEIIGKKVSKDIDKEDVITWDMVK